MIGYGISSHISTTLPSLNGVLHPADLAAVIDPMVDLSAFGIADLTVPLIVTSHMTSPAEVLNVTALDVVLIAPAGETLIDLRAIATPALKESSIATVAAARTD